MHPHIEAEVSKTAGLSVVRMCELLEVGRATFYRGRADNGRSPEQMELREAMHAVALKWPTYGSRRITEQLRRQDWEVNRKRIQRMMREDNLLCLRRPRSWVATTDSKHSYRRFPNLAEGMELTGINQLWVADITYIRLSREFVYLAGMLDAYSRRVIGWALDRSLQAGLCLEALEMALRRRRPIPATLVHHSDQGVQYASNDYKARLKKRKIRGSMGRKGNCYDNATMESFWKTLKYEQVYREEYATLEQARASIGRFIERIYNRKRLHSALGYRPPAEFEAIQE